jgi:hypothetical protein
LTYKYTFSIGLLDTALGLRDNLSIYISYSGTFQSTLAMSIYVLFKASKIKVCPYPISGFTAEITEKGTI